jgi:hypothetical protein
MNRSVKRRRPTAAPAPTPADTKAITRGVTCYLSVRVIIGEAVGKLSVSMAAAAAKLAKLVKSGDERIALAAAKEVVALGLKARRDEDLERQIADLTTRFEVIVASKVKGTTRAR